MHSRARVVMKRAVIMVTAIGWLLCPAAFSVSPKATKDPTPDLPPKTANTLNAIPVRGMWKHIVVHHTATPSATPGGIDRFHREKKHMENGMAYPFLIGNGHGMRDGEIFIGERWKRQIQGGHLASEQLNMSSIGICLVGNFESKPPTDRQMKSLEALVRRLLQRTGLSSAAVATHRSIHPHHTSCPGKFFSLPKIELTTAAAGKTR